MSDNFKVRYPGDPLCDALFATSSESAQRNRLKEYSERPIEVFPGIYSIDPDFLEIKGRVSVDATRLFPPAVDEYGRVTGNGIRGNFYGLRHLTGLGAVPSTYPMNDNRKLRSDMGLTDRFVKEWHERVYRSLTRLFFTGLSPVAMKMRVPSSSMQPFYTKKFGEKLEIARFALETMEQGARLMMSGDYVTPWVQFQLGGTYHSVYRHQSSDAVELGADGKWSVKTRYSADLLYATTGGHQGNYFPLEREVRTWTSPSGQEHHFPPGWFRERRRTAQGAPLGLNATYMPVAQSVRKHMYDDYAYTYHHTTRLSIQTDLRKAQFVILVDVTDNDRLTPTDFTSSAEQDELLRMGFADWWVHLYGLRHRLPSFVSDVAPGVQNALLGDWRDPSWNGGLMSGNAFTDITGSHWLTFVYFVIQVEHTYPSLERDIQRASDRELDGIMASYLKGRLPIALKDKSDDAVMIWNDPFLVPAAERLLRRMKEGKELVSPYMKVSYEHGGAFLGSILLYGENKKISEVRLIGNGNSLLTNLLSPEYGVQSSLVDRTAARRPFPGLAYGSLDQNYGSVPVYRELRDLLEFHWGRVRGESFKGLQEKWFKDDYAALQRHLKNQANVLPDLTPTEIDVLNDPSRLYWRYAPTDVRPEILNFLFKGLPLDVVEPHFRRIVPRLSQA